MVKTLILRLQEKAKDIRLSLVKTLTHANTGHYGGSLSVVEIVTALYFHIMRYNPKNPKWKNRDRFILSKGHACPLLYVVLAEAGYFPKKRLLEHRKLGSILQGHPDMKLTPGVEMSTGSLGQGLSAGVGMALCGKLDKKSFKVYVLIGDGESQEGQVWEAAMSAAHYKLDNLVAILDYNKFQAQGRIKELMGLEPVADKWRSFGWDVHEIDGHDFREILNVLREAPRIKGKPSMIIAHTVKGKGISFMEGDVRWHHLPASKEEAKKAVRELETKR